MDLKPHGTYEVDVRDGILFTEAEGPFNQDVVIMYRADVESLLDRLDRPWGQVLVLRGVSLFPEDAFMKTRQVITDTKIENGMTLSAIVVPELKYRQIVEMEFRRLYEGKPIQFEVFHNVQSAEEWVKRTLETAADVLSDTPG